MASLDHERLVQLIYDCAEDARGLHDALVEMAGQLGAQYAHTLVIERGVPLADNHFVGHDGSLFAAYDRDWRDRDPRFSAALTRPGEVLSDVAIVDSCAFERSAIYNEFLAPVDVRYTLFSNVSAGPELLVAQAFMRPKRAGAFVDEDVRRLSALLPHLCRAVRLRHLVGSLREQRHDLQEVLDTIPTAVALLDGAGRVRCSNTAAEALFTAGLGISTDRGVLGATSSDDARALAVAIGRAASLAGATCYRPPPAHLAPLVQIRRDDGEISIVFFPLRPGSALRAEREARVLAVFHDSRRVVRLDPGLVAKLHGLTSTEAAIATTLAAGGTLADFARERGCTELTARTHLKRILDKTGASRQADLVRVLLTGAAAHFVR